MDDQLKTSQQKRGEHHLAEGGSTVSADSSDTTEPTAGGEIKTTSGKLSLPEGD